MNESYDVVVVGGGAAGLSAALALGRARRSVLVVDAGAPRNAPAGHVHNYLGREGTPPGDLLATGREEVARYGGEVVTGTVVSARQKDETGGGFEVMLADGRAVLSRRLVVTTGLVDELPEVPGLAERWGRDVLHCPYCHGWEVRDQRIGVLATGPMAVHQALLFRQLSSDVTLLLHTAPALGATELEQLTARGVGVVEGAVGRLEVDQDRLVGVTLHNGTVVPLQALVVAPFFRASADVAVSLGLEPTEMQLGGHVMGTYVASDPAGATAVPDVWVAGNVADPRAQVVGSAAAGLNVAGAVNADLVAEDTARAVAAMASRREQHEGDGGHGSHGGHAVQGGHRSGPDVVMDAAFWEEMYRSRGVAWSGRPNAALVAETDGLTPGTALDIGCGEGADAIWLARRGWQVTAVDISATALRRGEAHAAHGEPGTLADPEAAGRVTWVQADLATEAVPAPADGTCYDLVSALFVHLPPGHRETLHRRLAAVVAPGGTLLVVGHHPDDVHAGVGRWDMPDLMHTADQVAEVLDPARWDVVVQEARSRAVTDDDGVERTVQDTVLAARRRA